MHRSYRRSHKLRAPIVTTIPAPIAARRATIAAAVNTTIAAALGALGVLGFAAPAHATVVYADNFNRSTISGSNTYTLAKTAGDAGASITGYVNPGDNGTLTLTNDATASANASGVAWVSTPTSAYAGPFNQTLSSNPNLLTWTFNLQQARSSPSGFGSGLYGAAVVLGATSNIFSGTGAANGYAVTIGNGGAPDPIRLVKFAAGVNGAITDSGGTPIPGTNITTLAADPGQNAAADYWSVKVTFDPASGSWNLFTRDDGSSAFADPAAGVYAPGLSADDTTYAAVPLTYSGALWSYNTNSGQTARFDNFQLDVQPTGPTARNLTWDGNGPASPGPSDDSGTWQSLATWLAAGVNTAWNNANPDNATFGAAAGPGTSTITLSNPQTAGSITFAANSATFTLTGSSLTLNGASGSGIGIAAHQSATINSALAVAAPQTWTIDDGATLTIGDGSAGGLSSTGDITKQGGGTVDLKTGGSTYSGSIDVVQGTLRISGAVAGVGANGSGAITVENGATLHLANALLGPTPAIPLTLNGDSTLLGTGVSSLRASNGPQIPNDAATVVTFATQSASDVLSINSAVRNVTASASPAGSKIVITGPGTVILGDGETASSLSNAFTGRWDVQGGVLQIGPLGAGATGDPLNALGYLASAGNSGPTSAVTLSGGLLAGAVNGVNAANPVIGATTIRSPLTLAGGGIASIGVDATFSGDIALLSDSQVLTTDATYGSSTPRTVVLATQPPVAGSAVTNGNLTWNNVNLDVNGNGTLRFARTAPINGGDPTANVAVTVGAALRINNSASVQLAGTQDALSDGTHHVDIINNSTSAAGLDVVANVKNVGFVSGVGNTVVENGATLVAFSIRQSSLTLHGNAKTRPDGSTTGTSKFATLSIDAGRTLDLSNNKLILTAMPVGTWNGSAYDGATGLIQAGRNGRTWTGSAGKGGIITSQTAAANHPSGFVTTLAVAAASDVKHITGAQTAVFGGQSISATDTLIMYTYAGDADLNGKVNGDDYFRIDSGFVAASSLAAGFTDAISIPTTSYATGDFDYNGRIDADDYFLIDWNYGAQSSSFPSGSVLDPGDSPSGVIAVPEPCGMIALALCTALIPSRRRRRSLISVPLC